LDKNNAAQWTAVKTYVKYIIQHLPGGANVSDVRIALAVVDGNVGGGNLVIDMSNSAVTDKLTMMAFVNDINTNRPDVKLEDSIRLITRDRVISDSDRSKANTFVIIRDSSVPDQIKSGQGDFVPAFIKGVIGDPKTVYFIRINDATEDANLTALAKYCKNYDIIVLDHSKSSYTELTHQDAYDFVKKELACEHPFGSVADAQEAVPTGITLPPPPPTEPTDHGETTVSSALSLTKTSSRVAGLWMCVTIVTTAAVSTF